jgi:hypothetical protein
MIEEEGANQQAVQLILKSFLVVLVPPYRL